MRNSYELPSSVKLAMAELLGSDVVEVPVRKRGLTSEGPYANCHTSVDRWVKQIGGKQISGWMLLPSFRRTAKAGIYHWVHHSVWETPEGKWVHVNKLGSDEKDIRNVIFCQDKSRDIESHGSFGALSFSHLTYLTSKRSIRYYKRIYGRMGEAITGVGFYWGSGIDIPLVPYEEYDGFTKPPMYQSGEPVTKNIKLLKRIYGFDLKIQKGKEDRFGYPILEGKWSVNKKVIKNLTFEQYTKMVHEYDFGNINFRKPYTKQLVKNGELPTPSWYKGVWTEKHFEE